MKFFADTSNINEILELHKHCLIQGVTTNPTLIRKEIEEQRQTKKEGDVSHWHEIVVNICNTIYNPVSAEVTSSTVKEMYEEGLVLKNLHEQIIVKLPCTAEGIEVCHDLSNNGVAVNMTLCFNVAQAVMASNAGAFYISPFVGRLDDYTAGSGVQLVKDIANVYAGSMSKTKILAASIRNVEHLNQVAPYADIATCPPKVIWDIFKHKLTVLGVDTFMNDWKKTRVWNE